MKGKRVTINFNPFYTILSIVGLIGVIVCGLVFLSNFTLFHFFSDINIILMYRQSS